MALEGDWIFLRAALPELQTYVISSDVYWTLHPAARMPGGAQVPQLTIGNLLLSLARLSALNLSAGEQAELENVQSSIAAVRAEWRANWGRKADQEFQSRLNLWQQYLRELRNEVHPSQAFYAREVRNRAILQLLPSEMTDGMPAHQQEQLNMLDGILRAATRPGSFVWEPELKDGFDQTAFWFLYLDVSK